MPVLVEFFTPAVAMRPYRCLLLLLLLLLRLVTASSSSSMQFNSSVMPGTHFDSRSFSKILSSPANAADDNSTISFALIFYPVHGSDSSDSFLLAVIMVGSPPDRVVWSANRDHLVVGNATLQFTADGDLVLLDGDGTWFWSTGTKGRSVAGMRLEDSGNLVLYDHANASVWQSFDHPTDVMLPGQTLCEGMALTANVSDTSWASGTYSLKAVADGLYFFVGSSPPQSYNGFQWFQPSRACTTFENGTLDNRDLHLFSSPQRQPGTGQHLRLESDGNLRLYTWNNSAWEIVPSNSFVEVSAASCTAPMACGKYGVCMNGLCKCPDATFFRQIDGWHPNAGCAPVTNLSCQSIKDHQFLALENVSYISSFADDTFTFENISQESCKQECLKNCSCKAALFTSSSDATYCFLPSELFSLRETDDGVSFAFIKVQKKQSGLSRKTVATIAVGATAGGSILLVVVLVFLRRKSKEMEEEEWFDQVPGMPTRFSFEELKVATDNFSKRIGEGGFGSVFAGNIGEEIVAVKKLEGADGTKTQFLREVETVGTIHHINLVKLIGFCAEKSHRLLVYEYMCNGSLDKWIFYKAKVVPFDWLARRKIITDIAKGLSYLHEECSRRIAHLDIKPQNILLDDMFNAKISDFGLAKLIQRDQSQVVTRLRGTRGYFAPEWFTSRITEKVDIYSFGIVVTEIICGRKNLDESQPEERIHLISMLQAKAKSGEIFDLVDPRSNDMQLHREEVLEMMKLAVWCLQVDCSKRPLMSTVVKVLEGAASVETRIDYDVVATPPDIHHVENVISTFRPSESFLSAPR